jgi:3-phenylpropionate/trans-cinnamate dioxygenase ferredoxin reductase subunit
VSQLARTDVLLIGGGVASARCARTLRRQGFAGSILLVGAEPMLPYNRPPLSKELLREQLPDDLVLAEPPAWYARRGVEARVPARVAELELDERLARLADGGAVRFERCLIATGAEPRPLPVPGGEHALLLRTLPDARRLGAAAREAGRGARVTVVGGGFIGVEVASALAHLGLRPTIVELATRLWGGRFGEELASWGAGRLDAAGVELRLGAAVTRLEAGAAWIGDEPLEHAFAVAGIGVVPRVALAAAGLATRDGIITDAAQRTGHPAVWAAGDVARVDGRRVEHWHAAREGGERAALSMLDRPVPPPPPSWFFSAVAGAAFDVLGDAETWSEERWIGDRVVAFLDGGRVSQLVVIDSALDPSVARRLVEERAAPSAVETALEGA